jgi:hypothetical protein
MPRQGLFHVVSCSLSLALLSLGMATNAEARDTSAMRSGWATFGDVCHEGQGTEFLLIRWGGRQDQLRKIVFDGHTKIHVFVPQGTTAAAGCGSFPNSGNFTFKPLDDQAQQ